MNNFGYDDGMEFRSESAFALFNDPFPPGMDMLTAPLDYRPPCCGQWPPVVSEVLPPPLPGSALPPPLPGSALPPPLP